MNYPDDEGNGWKLWSKHVLIELERLNKKCENIESKLNRMSLDIAMLKIKAGIWGAVAGAVPVAIALLVGFLKTK